jgi:hypothetical protein
MSVLAAKLRMLGEVGSRRMSAQAFRKLMKPLIKATFASDGDKHSNPMTPKVGDLQMMAAFEKVYRNRPSYMISSIACDLLHSADLLVMVRAQMSSNTKVIKDFEDELESNLNRLAKGSARLGNSARSKTDQTLSLMYKR